MTFAQDSSRVGFFLFAASKDIYLSLLAGSTGYGMAKYMGGVPAKKAFKPAAQIASFGMRAAANALGGIMGTTLTTKKGSRTLGRVAGTYGSAALLGYGIGAAYGVGIAHHQWGPDAGAMAWDIYKPGGITFTKALATMPENAYFISKHYASQWADDLLG